MICGKCRVAVQRGGFAAHWDAHGPEHRMPDAITLTAIGAEVMRARLKFPDNAKLLAALMEEVGELARAMLQRKPRDEIEREAIQVACVAIRLLEEGDSDFDGEGWSAEP